MKITIYQINTDRDDNSVAFEGFDMLDSLQGNTEVDSSLYDRVFEGEIDASSLERVYTIFNIDHPAGYAGRSMSVSDVIRIEDCAEVQNGFYYCDDIGFKQVEFDPDMATDRSSTLKVVIVEPGKVARAGEINRGLSNLQNAVGGGSIEAFYPFEEQVCIVCNEEGKLNGMPLNRAIRDEDTNEIMDIIAGPFFICDCSGSDFNSLNEEQLKRFTEKYKSPENFFRVNDKIVAVPYKPPKEHAYER